MLVLTAAHGHLTPAAVFSVAVTLGLGGITLLSVGYLLSARMNNPSVALHLAYIVPLVVLATSGELVPVEYFPAPVGAALHAIPTTWLVGALRALIAGANPPIPLAVVWSLLGVVTLAAGWVTSRTFRWTEVH